MSFLVKAASVATIVAAVFTVAAFYYNDPIEKQVVINSIEKVGEKERVPKVKERTAPDFVINEREIDSDKSPPIISLKVISVKHKAALKIPSTVSKSGALRELAEESSNLGYYKEAFEIALDIPSTVTKSSALRYVSLKVAESGDLEFAVKIADAIPSTVTKSSALREISGM